MRPALLLLSSHKEESYGSSWSVLKLWSESGFAAFFLSDGGWKNLIMILIAFVLLYLGIVKKFEPLLLVGIAFGCLLSNLSYFVALEAATRCITRAVGGLPR